MYALVVLILVAVIGWTLLSPADRFLSAFATMLSDAKTERHPLARLSGRAYLTGRYAERDVTVRLQSRRGRHSVGYLVIALRTTYPHSLSGADVDRSTSDDMGRRALATLAAHDLLLLVEDGVVKATWRPHGLTFFPGSFVSERWRGVMDAMATVAASLEAGSRSVTKENVEAW